MENKENEQATKHFHKFVVIKLAAIIYGWFSSYLHRTGNTQEKRNQTSIFKGTATRRLAGVAICTWIDFPHRSHFIFIVQTHFLHIMVEEEYFWGNILTFV